MSDDFNIDDLFGSDEFDSYELQSRINEFQEKLKREAMDEAFRFIEEVGILFWIRKDMYVKHDRKSRILKKMIKYFQGKEQYEKCALLYKGEQLLKENNQSITNKQKIK